jgi:4-hydroxymandelate oxidase
MNRLTFTRRQALDRLRQGSGAQGGKAAPRRPPRDELVNTLEFEEVAKQVLPELTSLDIASSHPVDARRGFDRITFRPRMLIPTLDLDLSLDLFGQQHFAPIIVGPVEDQRRFHPDGELATVRGASAAKAAVIISSKSSVPIRELAAEAKTPLWCAVYSDADALALKQVQDAVAAGCKVLCITSRAQKIDWKVIDQIRRGVQIPVVIKGVMTPADAKTAIDQGARGIVVSDHGGRFVAGKVTPIEVLPSIAEAVGGKAVILLDGSVQRGTDILKALVLGAQAVLVARPVMWGLAAYGIDGVQGVIELLQTTFGRNMGTIGAPNLKAITRSMVKVHAP